MVFGRPVIRVFMAIALVASIAWGFGQPAMAASSHNQASQKIVVDAAPEAVFSAAQQAFTDWSRGEFVEADEAQQMVTGVSRTNFFKFVDDIDVAISPSEADPGKTQISIHSVGRMGERDFGGNQRNIDEYLQALKALL